MNTKSFILLFFLHATVLAQNNTLDEVEIKSKRKHRKIYKNCNRVSKYNCRNFNNGTMILISKDYNQGVSKLKFATLKELIADSTYLRIAFYNYLSTKNYDTLISDNKYMLTGNIKDLNDDANELDTVSKQLKYEYLEQLELIYDTVFKPSENYEFLELNNYVGVGQDTLIIALESNTKGIFKSKSTVIEKDQFIYYYSLRRGKGFIFTPNQYYNASYPVPNLIVYGTKVWQDEK